MIFFFDTYKLSVYCQFFFQWNISLTVEKKIVTFFQSHSPPWVKSPIYGIMQDGKTLRQTPVLVIIIIIIILIIIIVNIQSNPILDKRISNRTPFVHSLSRSGYPPLDSKTGVLECSGQIASIWYWKTNNIAFFRQTKKNKKRDFLEFFQIFFSGFGQ